METLLFYLQYPFFFISFLSLFLYLYISPSNKKPVDNGFKKYPIVGSLPEFMKNRHRFLEWTTETLKRSSTNTATFHRPGQPNGVFTANPSNVEHILKNNFDNYPKGERAITFLEDLLGQGIFNSDGELWKFQRKIASHEFSTRSLRNFAVEIVSSEISTRLVPLLTIVSKEEQIVDLQDILERFAFDNICKMAFNVDPGCLGENGATGFDFKRAFDEATTISRRRFMLVNSYFWRFKKFFNVGSERALKKSVAVVHGLADDIIQSRMGAKAEKLDDDLLSRFAKYAHEKSHEFLRDIVMSFVLAGRDTTSSSLSWFFWLLSLNPRVEQNILRELELIRQRNGKNIGDTYSFEELKDMHYLHAAISESLRLYPPVPVNRRGCRNDDVLPDGTLVRKGWAVTYHPYAMGRMESIWGENCLEYLPERWLEDGIFRQENPFRFPIFHAGPRICIGKDMAYIQMKSIAASVIERFAIELQEKEKCPEYTLSLTLRMKYGLRVTVRERGLNVMN